MAEPIASPAAIERLLSSSAIGKQAAENAKLKYAPQNEGLLELKQAALERYKEAVQAGRTEGTLDTQAAQQAKGPTEQIFKTAQAEDERGRGLTQSILGALKGPTAGGFQAAAANEEASNRERLAQSQAHALSDLQTRAVAAQELPAYAQESGSKKLLTELLKLGERETLLRGEQSADTQTEITRQREEQNKLATAFEIAEGKDRVAERDTGAKDTTSEANNQRTTGTSRANSSEKTQAEYGTGGAARRASRSEEAKAINDAQQIKQVIGELGAHHHLSRAELVSALTVEEPEQSVKNKNGETVKIAKRPAYAPNGVMGAALDWAEYGYMRPVQEARLRNEGYNPASLGIPTEAQYRARAHAQQQSNASKSSAFGVAAP